MKNRTIPYGYAFESGKTVIRAEESGIVNEIFRSYLAGQPLSAIASGLNSRRIEYMPGTVRWDKARLKRILDDRRYIGEKGFPQIIGSDDFEKAQRVKSERARSVNTREEDAGYQIKLPVLCPHCHEKMQRKCNNRLRKKVKWKCGNGHTVYLDDESLLTKITDDLRKVADDVDILKGAERNETQGKILRGQENTCPAEDKKDSAKEYLLAAAARKYGLIDDEDCKTQRLKDIFADTEISESFPEELFEKAADAVVLEEDGSVGIVLMNGQVIR